MIACAKCGARKIVPKDIERDSRCSCGGVYTDLLRPVLDKGNVLVTQEPPAKIRDTVLQAVKDLEL